MRHLQRKMGKIHHALPAVLAGFTILSMALPTGAAADTFTLEQFDPATGFTTPIGTVTATQDGLNTVKISEVLNSNYRIHETKGSNHFALVFNTDIPVTIVGGNPGILANGTNGGGLSGAFGSFSAPPFNSGGFGWNSEITCTSPDCGPGWPGGNPGPLTFDITAAGLTPADLQPGAVYNGRDIYFASDLVTLLASGAASTGNAGADPAPGPAPGAGIGSLAFLIVAGAFARARGFFAL
jgi:hypothetical protein